MPVFCNFLRVDGFENQDWQDFRRFGCLSSWRGEINNFASIIFGTVKCYSNFTLIKAHTFTHLIYLVNYCETLNIIEEGRGGAVAPGEV